MMSRTRATLLLAGVATMAVSFAGQASAQSWLTGPAGPGYVAGDFHNHTTCIDGSVSVQYLADKALNTWGLDWFVHANHGGSGTRDCRFMDPEFDGSHSGNGKYWTETLGKKYQNITINTLKGDAHTATEYGATNAPTMWRWQSIAEIDYPILMARSQKWGKLAIEGLEQNVPGHEHVDTEVVGNQFPAAGGGDAQAMSEYEYQFDRNDTDTSGGGGQWTTLTSKTSAGNTGTTGHAKAVTGVQWMQTNYPTSAWFIPTHVERQGVFKSTGNNGFNAEHFRDFNNAGPTVAFGFDGPGHQANSTRGSYGSGAVGGGTFGGRGYYTATVGGLWDSLLGEGRNFFYYGSSDFHTRGIFGPTDRSSTADFYPGEYEKNYVYNSGSAPLTAQGVVDAMRTGNSFNVLGGLITEKFSYTACTSKTNVCATMGQTLVVPAGESVFVRLTFNTPVTNHSPYNFPNPVLAQVGINQPLNAPKVDHVDFITGDVTGLIAPGSASYTSNTNSTTAIAKTVTAAGWNATGNGAHISWKLGTVTKPMYVRVRGTNVPPATPNVTDAAGNPLSDTLMANVLCVDAGCPSHLPVNGASQKTVGYDVAAWSNMWFYANPIFIRPEGSSKLPVEVAADTLASIVASAP